jgi:phospholipase/lecithinase/hemolysin
LANFPSAIKDSYGCAKEYNEVSQHFNSKLKEALNKLREDLPHATIIYVDIYSAKYSLFQNPKKYGESNQNTFIFNLSYVYNDVYMLYLKVSLTCRL